MHVEDGGGADGEQPVRVVERAGGQQVVGLALGHGEDDGVGAERLAGDVDGPAGVAVGADGGDAGAGLGADARGVECLAGEPVVQVAERHPGPADVGGAGVGEQAGLEDHRGERQRGVARDGVEGGDPDEVPQCLDGARGLAVGGEPAAEVLLVQGGIAEVEALQGERGAAHPGPVGERQVGVRGEAAAEVEGHRQRVAPQPSQPPSLGTVRVDHGDVEAVLQRRQAGSPDAVEEPAVGGAAAQVDVLAVVDGEVAAPEGEGESAQAGPPFEEGDAHAGVGEGEGGGGAGQSAADHDGVASRRDRAVRVRGPRGACAVAHAPSPVCRARQVRGRPSR